MKTDLTSGPNDHDDHRSGHPDQEEPEMQDIFRRGVAQIKAVGRSNIAAMGLRSQLNESPSAEQADSTAVGDEQVVEELRSSEPQVSPDVGSPASGGEPAVSANESAESVSEGSEPASTAGSLTGDMGFVLESLDHSDELCLFGTFKDDSDTPVTLIPQSENGGEWSVRDRAAVLKRFVPSQAASIRVVAAAGRDILVIPTRSDDTRPAPDDEAVRLASIAVAVKFAQSLRDAGLSYRGDVFDLSAEHFVDLQFIVLRKHSDDQREVSKFLQAVEPGAPPEGRDLEEIANIIADRLDPMTVDIGVATDRGPREVNQDRAFGMSSQQADSLGSTRTRAAVCDGMGGHMAGDHAAELAAKAIWPRYATDSGMVAQRADQLGEQVREANRTVHEAGQRPAFAGMGTTATVVDVCGRKTGFAHVGDSRGMIVNAGGEIRQFTADHNLVSEKLASGEIQPGEEHTVPQNIITRALGPWPDVPVDIGKFSVSPGDSIVLSSDGVWGPVESAEIANIVNSAKNAQEAAHALVSTALANGGSDNATAVVIKFVQVKATGRSAI